jgi:hypothetical protein
MPRTADTPISAPLNPYVLGAQAPNDLDGRMFDLEQRLKALGQSLRALAHSDYEEVEMDTLNAFGRIALEMSSEIANIHLLYVDEWNMREGGH